MWHDVVWWSTLKQDAVFGARRDHVARRALYVSVWRVGRVKRPTKYRPAVGPERDTRCMSRS